MIEEEMSKIDERGLEKLGTLHSSEKTIAILGGRWWPQTAKRKGRYIRIFFLCNIWKNVMSVQMLEVSLRSQNGACLLYTSDAADE